MKARHLLAIAITSALSGCGGASSDAAVERPLLSGTEHPFASEAVYFVITDRFVDGDPSNNFEQDSGWNRELVWPNGEVGNVGYQGGDFKGLLDHADYIREMGFSAVWMTPIVKNPAEAFSGGKEIKAEGFAMDRGKAGYHGYWGVNFFEVDKHLPSEGLGFPELTQSLKDKGLKTVLDVVINHGSPAYTMPEIQADYGKLYDKDGRLVADHMNLKPADLTPDSEPLHAFFNTTPDLAELADMNVDNPAVMDYFVSAYLQWLSQGADAFRIDTVKHVPASAWDTFSKRIRAQYPDLFMFGEVYSFDAQEIGQYTQAGKGEMSVLDFPMKQALADMFEKGQGFEQLADTLYLDGGPYANPYELTIFYDNHDMPRIDTDDNGFINAHNWLFTARGIPVVYYGSEIGFERGKAEHKGNRNYFGVENIEKARSHPIRARLSEIAKVRQANVALQRGLQLNLELQGNRAAFYRVYQNQEVAQTALVLLNKGNDTEAFNVSQYLAVGEWVEAISGETRTIAKGEQLSTQLAGNSVQVWINNGAVEQAELLKALGTVD
ncbi:alpha-amylase family glycosyl hydrolase [Paraferrimonas sedimenticola]|uniref:Alpha-amylase n=1 Tax=Paraferrimonas sedimenticola TaxID=375674 RepID=A0AA37W0S1_9GAMM|nr:alpha-amylase family glycosyl hydrolase [Paraferrimonas sedimenticola]GLP95848.1 cyclomaltodextrin glucanotransferase [Paraferrimonas sedimenticola]